MAELATLGVNVDFRTVKEADAALQQLEQTGKSVERSTRSLTTEAERNAQAMARITRDVQAASRDYHQGRISVEDYATAVAHARQEQERMKASAGGSGALAAAERDVKMLTAANRELARSASTVATAQPNMANGFELSRAGANRLAGALGPLVNDLAGVPPQIGNVARAFATVGLGATAVTGVLLAASAISAAYRLLTSDSRKLREEQDQLIERLREAGRLRDLGPVGAARADEAVARQRLQEAITRRDRAQATLNDPDQYDAATLIYAQRQVEKYTDEIIKAGQAIRSAHITAVEAQDQAAEAARAASAQYQQEAESIQSLNNQLANLKITLDAVRAVGPTNASVLSAAFGMGSIGGLLNGRPAALDRNVGGINIPGSINTRITGPALAASDPFWTQGGGNWFSRHTNFSKGLAGAGMGLGLLENTKFGQSAAGMALTGAAQYASMGATFGPVGAVAGAAVGFVKGLLDHGKAAREAAAALRDAKKQFDMDIEARRAAAAGNTQMAEDLRRQAQYERELAEARKNGMTKAQIAALQAVQYEEKLAVARDRATAAIKEQEEAQRALAESTRNMTESLTVRGLRALGRGDAADTAALAFSQAREWEAAQAQGLAPDTMRQLAVVQAIEKQTLADQQLLKQQVDAVNAFAAAELKANEQALALASEQLRTQQQTVTAMRQVVDTLTDYARSLATSPNSPLSPRAQLDAARSQFETMRALALGGDLSAAQSLPGSANALLNASRGYNASSMGYVTDFQRVQESVNAVRDQFSGRLSIEERQLAELQRQTALLEAQREQIQASAAAQIQAFQDEFNTKQNRLYEAWQKLETIATNTETGEVKSLRDSVANLQKKYDEMLADKNEQIAELIVQLTNALTHGFGGLADAYNHGQESLAAAIEAGLMNPNVTYQDEG